MEEETLEVVVVLAVLPTLHSWCNLPDTKLLLERKLGFPYLIWTPLISVGIKLD